MSYRKFDPNDIILNTMRAAPHCEFYIDPGSPGSTLEPGGTVYYNNTPTRVGKFVSNVMDVPDGFISLYELNIDRYESNLVAEPQNPLITSFVYKDSSRYRFKTVMTGSDELWDTSTEGEKLYAAYPLSASITRDFMTGTQTQNYDLDGVLTSYGATGAGQRILCTQTGSTSDEVLGLWPCRPAHRHYYALRQKLNSLGWRSHHYAITGAWTGSSGTPAWIKDQQKINLLSIPTIFYGSKIKPGTVSCKFYYTGSLIGELVDTKRNGELIQVSGAYGSTNIGKVAGVVLYEEGFLLLTGSWDLCSDDVYLVKGAPNPVKPQWIYFGAGAQDGVNYTTVRAGAGDPPSYVGSNLSFRGETETPVMTMFAHANRGETNFSNNPTFIKKGQALMQRTSSTVYEENPNRVVKNTVSSSYPNQSASFERQVYISRIGLYDEAQNLIGVATLARPILKKEQDAYTFKLRLDL